jgi:hypothetical protein
MTSNTSLAYSIVPSKHLPEMRVTPPLLLEGWAGVANDWEMR